MQTILGAGGVVGRELAKSLREYKTDIRLVSRNPLKVNDTDQLMAGDLTIADDVYRAVEGSDIVYLTPGFPYALKVWQAAWPLVMKNTLDACKAHGAKLVFFDNIYMYDPARLNPITETHKVNPSSEKGKVRALIAAMLMDEVEKGGLTALIARAPDFYGPGIKGVSILTESVFNKLASGKKADWFGADNCKHSFIYTPDAGKGTAMLGNAEDTWNQVWHLPTAPNPLTGKEWVEAIAKELDVKPGYRAASKSIVSLIALFSPLVKELKEMLYQYTQDYVFDSSKFEKHFNFTPTTYAEGIRKIVELDYK